MFKLSPHLVSPEITGKEGPEISSTVVGSQLSYNRTNLLPDQSSHIWDSSILSKDSWQSPEKESTQRSLFQREYSSPQKKISQNWRRDGPIESTIFSKILSSLIKKDEHALLSLLLDIIPMIKKIHSLPSMNETLLDNCINDVNNYYLKNTEEKKVYLFKINNSINYCLKTKNSLEWNELTTYKKNKIRVEYSKNKAIEILIKIIDSIN